MICHCTHAVLPVGMIIQLCGCLGASQPQEGVVRTLSPAPSTKHQDEQRVAE